MLDLSRVVMRLTQGQAPGEMTPLGGGQAPASEGDAAATSAPAQGTGAVTAATPAAATDVRAVADRVYELLRQDALLASERTGKR